MISSALGAASEWKTSSPLSGEHVDAIERDEVDVDVESEGGVAALNDADRAGQRVVNGVEAE